MTAYKRAAQFPDDMESCNNGSKMWCIHCHVPVNYLEKSYARGHIKGATHKKHKKEGKAVNYTPSPARPSTSPGPEPEKILDCPSTSSTAPTVPQKVATFAQQKQVDMQKMMEQGGGEGCDRYATEARY